MGVALHVFGLLTCLAGKRLQDEMKAMSLAVAQQPDSLLCEPSKKDTGVFSKSLRRCEYSYENHCQQFIVKGREFKQQYAHLYYVRLTKMRERIKEVARQKWGE